MVLIKVTIIARMVMMAIFSTNNMVIITVTMAIIITITTVTVRSQVLADTVNSSNMTCHPSFNPNLHLGADEF